MAWLYDPGTWIGLMILFVLEVVLGMDNLVFLAVLTAHLPDTLRDRAEKIGLAMAVGLRLALLGVAIWVSGLTEPVTVILGHALSWRDLALVAGGIFLLVKTVHEIHGALEGHGDSPASDAETGPAAFRIVLTQMAILNAVFSLDSIVTALGLTAQLWVMAVAVAAAMVAMLTAAPTISVFLDRHPAVKMLALSCLLLVGTGMVAEGSGLPLTKGYLYFAIGVAALVETVDLLRRRGASGRSPGE
jgi:predicted tellurium resistance membrane protein TerC